MPINSGVPVEYRHGRSSTIVVIPAYNEERNVVKVIEDLRRTVPDYDRVVVNDGARDGTAQAVNELGERQLRLRCNLGYGRAVQAGLRYALECGYEVVVTFDADGQHRAADIPQLVRALTDNHADLVIGSRYANGSAYHGPLDRRVGQRLFSYFASLLTRQRFYDTTSGMKAMRASACNAIVHSVAHDFHTETIVALSRAGYRIVEVPITMEARTDGRSMHSTMSNLTYPMQTLLVTVVALVDGGIVRRVR